MATKKVAGWIVEAQRRRSEYDNAVSMLEMLSAPSPVWACGTPVTPHDILNFRRLNAEVVSTTPKEYLSDDHWNDYNASYPQFAKNYVAPEQRTTK